MVMALYHIVGPVIIGDSPTSPTVNWIQQLKLVESDRIKLQEGVQLIDKHMDASISVLAKQFPEMPAPQSILLTQNLRKAQDQSMFFYNYSGHWVLSSLSGGVVHLYDSLQPKCLHPDLRTQN